MTGTRPCQSRRRWVRAAGGVLFLLAVLTTAPVRALDLNGLTRGLLENAESIGRALENADVLLGEYSEEQEHQLGRGAAAVLLGAAPLHPDVQVQRYVNQLGSWLVRHTERPGIAWRFGVLDTDGANAFAAPGGYVFVSRGLMLLMRDEAELAGVLAHEVAHVLSRHHLRAFTAQERFKLAADVALQASDSNALLGEALVGVTREVYARGLDQGDEFEADAMGVVIAARGGYDPYGLAHVLKTIEGAAGDGGLTGFFLSTHPPTGERLLRLQQQLSAGYSLPDPPPRTRFASMQARLARR